MNSTYNPFQLSGCLESHSFALQAREFLKKHGDLSQTQIFAKIENVEVS